MPHASTPVVPGDRQPEGTPAPITVLIVDDEQLARDRLRVLLEGEPDMTVVGECANGLEALAVITARRPELVFLDVQMPDLDGLGVIDALNDDELPEIVFVTAFNAYMERAFEVHAVDYLRKPYTNARFASALAHARRRVKARRAEASAAVTSDASTRSQLAPILASVRGERSDTRIALRDVARSSWHIIYPDEIDWVEGEGASRVRVHVGADSYVWKKTLTELEHSLDPRHFMRIHRSHLVNTRRIRHVKQLQKGEYAVALTDETVLDTGRTYRAAIERFLAGKG